MLDKFVKHLLIQLLAVGGWRLGCHILRRGPAARQIIVKLATLDALRTCLSSLQYVLCQQDSHPDRPVSALGSAGFG